MDKKIGIGCSSSYNFNLENVFNVIEIDSNDVSNPSCTNSTGSVNIDFSNSINIFSSGTFGSISLYEDLDNNCIIDIEDFFVEAIDIPNDGSINMSLFISDLEPGNYVYLIEDSFGCQTTSCFSISNNFLNPDPNVFFGFEDAICFNASGSAYVSLDPADIGGVPFDIAPFYDVEWLDEDGNIIQINSNDELIASSLFAGNYTVIITDSNDCSFEYNFTISQPTLALNSGVSYDDVNCNGACNAEIVIQPVGGVSDYYSIRI